jgi:hypothetical protein
LQRDPKSLLWDAREAAEFIAAVTSGKSFADFDGDIVLRSAVELSPDPFNAPKGAQPKSMMEIGRMRAASQATSTSTRLRSAPGSR